MSMRILLVEDEPKSRQSIQKGLEENDFEVVSAGDGISGKEKALSETYDVIVTDIIMPGLSGLDLVKDLRRAGVQTPILVLTALGGADHVVEGLETGADDYLAKPFEFKELLARIRTLNRRNQAPQQIAVERLTAGDLEMNVQSRMVKRGDQRIVLTAREFALLEYLLRNKGRVLSRMDLAKNVWKIDFDTGTNMVEVYVNYLRKKVDVGFQKKLIHTQVGMGYFIKE